MTLPWLRHSKKYNFSNFSCVQRVTFRFQKLQMTVRHLRDICILADPSMRLFKASYVTELWNTNYTGIKWSRTNCGKLHGGVESQQWCNNTRAQSVQSMKLSTLQVCEETRMKLNLHCKWEMQQTNIINVAVFWHCTPAKEADKIRMFLL